jgi:hypothetical protein
MDFASTMSTDSNLRGPAVAVPQQIFVPRRPSSGCTIANVIKTAFKFLFQGFLVALAVRFMPAYGAVIDSHELLMIALSSALVGFLLKRILPTATISIGNFSLSSE